MQPGIEIKTTKTHGQSIFATKNFKKDDVIFTVTGELTERPTIYTIPIGFNTFIDDRGVGKFLCHSCEPNCGIRNLTQIVAMRNISEGEEITVDYAMFVYDYKDEMTDANRICKCGSALCRGELGSYKVLPDNLKAKYLGYISGFLLP